MCNHIIQQGLNKISENVKLLKTQTLHCKYEADFAGSGFINHTKQVLRTDLFFLVIP